MKKFLPILCIFIFLGIFLWFVIRDTMRATIPGGISVHEVEGHRFMVVSTDAGVAVCLIPEAKE